MDNSFHFTDLRPGMILNMSTTTRMGGLIRRALRFGWKGDVRDIPNHDAIIVEHDGKLWVGESVSPVAKLVPVEDYEKGIAEGKIYRIRVLNVPGTTEEDGRKASKYWLDEIHNSPYDWMALPRLLFKAIFGNWINSAAGWTWARWCTEGICEAWAHGAERNPWSKLNPTPLTTYRRWQEGRFILVPQ